MKIAQKEKKLTPVLEKFDIRRQRNLFSQKVASTGKVTTQIDLTIKSMFSFC